MKGYNREIKKINNTQKFSSLTVALKYKIKYLKDVNFSRLIHFNSGTKSLIQKL